MTFFFGARSRSELIGVHPDLVEVVKAAILVTPIDFTVLDGVRTDAQQREYVRTGASHTLRSKHLRQKDGYGHAVDLVPYVNGKLRWELPLCIKIAQTMAMVSVNLGVSLVWGGGWDRLGLEDPGKMVDIYIERKLLLGERPFIDGPHYQKVIERVDI